MDCLFAHQHITSLQAKHNAKKKDKQKHSNTKAEWLMSEANRERRAQEKVECEKKEAEEKVAKDQKEAKACKKFVGLVTGKKTKDDLKDIVQALCLGLGGKNQELADHINHYLDESPELQNDEWFKGLFTARMKKRPDLKKQKNLTPAASDRDQDEGGDTIVPPTQRPQLL
ncbi:hypothetical protein BDM02DRAFT_3193247 [Thelephora ganbajun]|uniref:Uncharacterized protein n=1 Tax=Thelephora ganbajun TaxID=370292 RepID=A0ACB6YYW0_THEGA|nr:hypothetical protein BDM02DRAFT_3193247 [Thelephora ganbajun]